MRRKVSFSLEYFGYLDYASIKAFLADSTLKIVEPLELCL